MSPEDIAKAEAEIERLTQESMARPYYLQVGDEPEREVTMQEWVAAERRAGFYNTMGHPERPATGGFSDGKIKGRRG